MNACRFSLSGVHQPSGFGELSVNEFRALYRSGSHRGLLVPEGVHWVDSHGSCCWRHDREDAYRDEDGNHAEKCCRIEGAHSWHEKECEGLGGE